MKQLQSILISVTIAIFVIGVHQTFKGGFQNSYWIFMLSLALLFLYQLLTKDKEGEKSKSDKKGSKKGSKAKSGLSNRRKKK